VAEQAPKDVGEEILQQGGFLEIVSAAGSDEAGPVPEFLLLVPHALGQVEAPHLLAEDFGVEERFGFERHLFSGRLCRTGKKPSAFLPGPNIEPRTSDLKAGLAICPGKSIQAR
jgi:hypothetical protein